MKKIICILFLLVLTVTSFGCKAKETGTEEELKAEIRAEMEAETRLKGELKVELEKEKTEKNPLKDIDAVIEFVNTTELNQMYDGYGELIKIGDNYETLYFDFTGDDNEDVAIVSWTKDDNYRPIIFVTWNKDIGDYNLINSDFRASKGAQLSYEDGFIIKEDKKDNSIDIAYNVIGEYIQMVTRYVPIGEREYSFFPPLNIKQIYENEFIKTNGYSEFTVKTRGYFVDEYGTRHQMKDGTDKYTFDKTSVDYSIETTENMQPLDEFAMAAKVIKVGNDTNLNEFNTVYEKGDLESALKYYYNNRDGFTKEARIQYIKAFGKKRSEIFEFMNYGSIYPLVEDITDGKISTTFDFKNPIPEKMQSVYSVAKVFGVEDGANPPDNIAEDGGYDIVCINPEISMIFKIMEYDMDKLSCDDTYSFYSDDMNVITEFSSGEQMLNDIKDYVYPSVLIHNLSELKYLKHEDIWKTTMVLVPEEIEFVGK